MSKFEITTSFAIVDKGKVHGTKIQKGEYTVQGTDTLPDEGIISERAAEVAQMEGWGAPLDRPQAEPTGLPSQSSGPVKQSSFSQAARPQAESKPKKSKAKRAYSR